MNYRTATVGQSRPHFTRRQAGEWPSFSAPYHWWVEWSLWSDKAIAGASIEDAARRFYAAHDLASIQAALASIAE